MPTCTTCDDSHRMEIGVRTVPCTHCPRPCRQCASSNGRGIYCEVAPCACSCHRGMPAPMVKPCQWCGAETTNSHACNACWELQRLVMKATSSVLLAMVRRCKSDVAAHFLREGFAITRDNVTATICNHDDSEHVDLDWTGAESEIEITIKGGS